MICQNFQIPTFFLLLAKLVGQAMTSAVSGTNRGKKQKEITRQNFRIRGLTNLTCAEAHTGRSSYSLPPAPASLFPRQWVKQWCVQGNRQVELPILLPPVCFPAHTSLANPHLHKREGELPPSTVLYPLPNWVCMTGARSSSQESSATFRIRNVMKAPLGHVAPNRICF